MSSFCIRKNYLHFFSKNISIYAIFDDQSFNDTLTKDIVSIEHLGPESQRIVEKECAAQNNSDINPWSIFAPLEYR